MEMKPASSRVSSAGPADWFTGPVWMDELAALPGTAVRALRVTFSPGARTTPSSPGRVSSTGTAPRRTS
jgi:quercetin dioxygenase-like cupin family protein